MQHSEEFIELSGGLPWMSFFLKVLMLFLSCVLVYVMCTRAQVLKAVRDFRSPGAEILSSCEPPRILGIKSGPLEEQSMLLILEPSLQPCLSLSSMWYIFQDYKFCLNNCRGPATTKITSCTRVEV